MKTNPLISNIYNRFHRCSESEINDKVEEFLAYSELIAGEINPNHTPLTSAFIDYSRRVAQKRTYDILQADSDMYNKYYSALKDYEDYFFLNFNFSEQNYLKYYKSIERAIDKAKVDDNTKFTLHFYVNDRHEKTVNKIKTLRQELNNNYLMIVNSTRDTPHL